MTSLASGTVTLLFTDIEGSTRLLQTLGEEYEAVLIEHHRLLREEFRERGGTEVDAAGDSLYYSFPSARAALAAALAAQRGVLDHRWPKGAQVLVRMGLHTGEPVSGEVGYVGLDVHRAARICAAGHGGQILISQTTRDLTGDDLPDDVGLLDLGEHRLRDLAATERLFQVIASGLPREFPPLRSTDARPNNLPRQLTSFVGRHQEIGEAKRMLSSAPLLTLTGPGGVGKTRLAIELAADMLDGFDDGVWFVDLGPITDPAFVVPGVASALGVSEASSRPILDTVVDHLRGRRLLLVLDNCEHLLEAAAEAADALLRSCPSVRLVATSREALAIRGEALFPVPSLSVPDSDGVPTADGLSHYEAVRLFADRAMAASPSFGINDRNARSIAQVCRRLDGVPLALELAAARVRTLSVEQIAARLDDRFRLLTGSSRITVPRHQTLRATIDWSYDLLAEEERALLRRMSVFAGGCTLEGVEAVCAGDPVAGADVLDLLSHLVDKSLVVAETAGDEGRYQLLETVRQYARDRLLESGEARDALRRHRDWYLAMIEQAAPEFFKGAESGTWLDRLDREHDNLRAALQWSDDEPHESRAGLRLAAGLWRFWEIRGHLIEGRGWLERMLKATSGEVSALRADAFTGAGILAFVQGDYRAASALHEESLAQARGVGDPGGIAFASNNLANAALLSGDYATARRLYEVGLAWARERGDLQVIGFALINMAEAVAMEGDHAGARARFEEGMAAFRQIGDRWGEAFALDSFGVVASRQENYVSAQSLHEQALAISRELGDERGVARALTHLADVASRTQDRPRARALHRESLEIRQALGDLPGIALAMEKLACVEMTDDAYGAARLLGAAEGLREAIRAPVPPTLRDDYDTCRRALRSGLGDGPFDAARSEGRRMTPTEAVATFLP